MAQIECPYTSAEPRWLKGNLHAHTTESDGACSPADVIADYASRGYDFLAVSDHDLLVPLDAYRAATPLTLIQATESGGGPHILCVGLREGISPTHDRQAVIDQAVAQGGMAILNHPNWGTGFRHWSQDTLESLHGHAGIEIYNGIIDFLEGSSLATDRWDMLLSKGLRVWGFANDDSHAPEHVGRAWAMVDSPERTEDAVCSAMRAGRFYASTGVAIRSVVVEGSTLVLRTENAQRVRFVTRHGAVRSIIDGPDTRFEVQGDEGYVRAECYGPGDTMAWTQPIFVVPD